MTQTTKSLSFLDRFLPLWTTAAVAIDLILGRVTPSLVDWLAEAKIATISVPIAIGLLVMMYPPLAKVRYDRTGGILTSRKLTGITVFLSWILGPALMFTLVWMFLSDSPELRIGVIIVGLARCIAMVLVWNDLSCGDTEVAAVLVTINSLFQIFTFSALGWFYLQILPSWLELETTSASFSFWAITLSVVVFLGTPLLTGVASRIIDERTRGCSWYENKYLPKISPLALAGLPYTIVLLSTLQSQQTLRNPWTVAKVTLPLVIYFLATSAVALASAEAAGMNYATSASITFAATGNNFELATAIAVSIFDPLSQQTLVGTIGPLIEVPVLVALVYVTRWLRPHLFPNDLSVPDRL